MEDKKGLSYPDEYLDWQVSERKLTKEFWEEFEETGTKLVINEDSSGEIIKPKEEIKDVD